MAWASEGQSQAGPKVCQLEVGLLEFWLFNICLYNNNTCVNTHHVSTVLCGSNADEVSRPIGHWQSFWGKWAGRWISALNSIHHKSQRPVSGSQMVAPLVAQNVTAQPGLFKCSCKMIWWSRLVPEKRDNVQYRGPSIHTDKMDTCGLNYTVRQIESDQEVTCSTSIASTNCEFLRENCKLWRVCAANTFLLGNCLWSIQENSEHRWKSESNALSEVEVDYTGTLST